MSINHSLPLYDNDNLWSLQPVRYKIWILLHT